MGGMERYSRQILLPGFGEEGQRRLAATRVLLVGAGGLGSPVATCLTAAGTGTLGIVDGDTVSLSNLQRQTLYRESDLGLGKAECAVRALHGLNSEVVLRAYPFFIDKDNAEKLIASYDIIVDACDNFAARFLLNDCCLRLGKPFVHASIQGLRGQVSVFGLPSPSGKIHSYRDLYDEEELKGMDAPGKEVLGSTPAVIGGVEAHQVLQIASGCGEPLAGRLWCIDLGTMESHIIELP